MKRTCSLALVMLVVSNLVVRAADAPKSARPNILIIVADDMGFSDAGALILGLALPALLCRPEDVARTAAGTFTLSYGGAMIIAVVCGAAWDLSGRPALAFLPLAGCALALAASAMVLRGKGNLG